MSEVEVKCPICKRMHRFKAEIREFWCRGRHLVLLRGRNGWRLMEVKVITEREDAELDRVWGSED